MRFNPTRLHECLSEIQTFMYKDCKLNDLSKKMLFNICKIAESEYIRESTLFDLYSYLTTLALQTNNDTNKDISTLCLKSLKTMRIIENKWRSNDEEN